MSATLLLTGGQVTFAQSEAQTTPPADVPDGMEWDPEHGLRSDILSIDAEEIARQTGADPAVIRARLAAQARTQDVIGVAERTYPALVGIYWTNEGVTAQFVGAAPAAAVELLATAGAPVTVESVRFTARELDGFAAHVSIILAQAGCGDCLTAIDPQHQRIVATVGSDVGASIEAIRAEVARSLPDVDVAVDGAVSPIFRHDSGNVRPDPEVAATQARQLFEAFPHLGELALAASHEGGVGGCDDDLEFGFGLDLIPDGLDRLRDGS